MLATAVYSGDIVLPAIQSPTTTSTATSLNDDKERTIMMEQKGKKPDEKPQQGRDGRSLDDVARILWDSIPPESSADADSLRAVVNYELAGVDNPTEVFRRYIKIYEEERLGGDGWKADLELRARRADIIFLVAEAGHPGLLPCIEELLLSEHACERARGAMALRFYDEERAIREIATVYTDYANGRAPLIQMAPVHLIFELNTIGTPNALETAGRLLSLTISDR